MTATVIIGAGMAAYTCAREIRKLDKQMSLAMVSADAGEVYSKPMLSNAIANEKSPAQLVTSTAAQMAQTLEADILTHTTIDKIDVANRQIIAGDRTVAYENLVLALGAQQRDPGLDNPDAVTIHQINHLDHYRQFRQHLSARQHVVVVGAGLIGCEFANDLVAGGYRCSVISPDLWPLANLLPQAAGEYFMQRLSASGIQWQMGGRARALGKAGSGIEVALENNVTVSGDLLLSAVGLTPHVALAQAAGLHTRRGIVVNEYLRTSDPHVCALGDCAEFNGQVLPFILPIMHGARALAANLTGKATALRYPLMPVVVKTPACPICVLPAAKDQAGYWDISEVEDGLRAVYGDGQGQVFGFALLGAAMAERQFLVKQMMKQAEG